VEDGEAYCFGSRPSEGVRGTTPASAQLQLLVVGQAEVHDAVGGDIARSQDLLGLLLPAQALGLARILALAHLLVLQLLRARLLCSRYQAPSRLPLSAEKDAPVAAQDQLGASLPTRAQPTNGVVEARRQDYRPPTRMDASNLVAFCSSGKYFSQLAQKCLYDSTAFPVFYIAG
jgi:hypothetical protein